MRLKPLGLACIFISGALHSDAPSSAFSAYGIEWVRTGVSNSPVFQSVMDIDAPIEAVWSHAIDIEHYKELSDGAIDAHVDGVLAPGKFITMNLARSWAPISIERVTIVDHALWVTEWVRELPLNAGTTERFQVLESLGPNRTRSYIALRVPRLAGRMINFVFRKTILDAFNSLQEGIKLASERK